MADLLTDVEAFYLEHRRYGALTDQSPEGGGRIVMTCSCGASLSRALDAARDRETSE
jgi:hypothetical protein